MWVLLSYCLPDWEEQMGPSADSQKQSHVCKPWSSWGTPSTQIPAGHNTAGHKGSERFLEHRDGDFLMQRVEEPAKADTDRSDTNMKVVGSLGFSDHELWNSRS